MLINFLLLALLALASFFALRQILLRKRQRKCSFCSLAKECNKQTHKPLKAHPQKEQEICCTVFKD